jgi:hypothetical protein
MFTIDLIFQRVILPILLIGLILLIHAHMLMSGSMLWLTILLLLPLIILLLRRPKWLFALVLFTGPASIAFPGLPQDLLVRDVLASFFVIVAIIHICTNHKSRSSMFRAARWMAVLFSVIIVLHVAVRGIGIRALGSDSWGGMSYIRALIAAGFLLYSNTFEFNKRELNFVVILYIIGLTIPGIAHTLFLLSDGAIYQQYFIIRKEDWALLDTMRVVTSDVGVLRFYFLTGVGAALIMLTLVYLPWRWIIPGLLTAFPLLLLSGFRNSIISMFLTLFFFTLLYSKSQRLKRAGLFLSATIAVYFILMPIVHHLPDSFQRTLSILPGYNVSELAKMDAQGTIEWRMQIWSMMYKEIPDNLIIGRGFTSKSAAYEAVDPIFKHTPEFAYESHNYHNGPLAILLDLGIPGLLITLGLLLMSFMPALSIRRPPGQDDFLIRLFTYCLASQITSVVIFIFIYGDSLYAVPNMIYSLVLLSAVANTLKEQNSSLIANTPDSESKSA